MSMLKRPLSAFMLGACLFALGACDSKDDPVPDAGVTTDAGTEPDAGTDAGSTDDVPPVIPEGHTLLTPSAQSQSLPWDGQPVTARFAFVAQAGRHYDFTAESERIQFTVRLRDAAGVTLEEISPYISRYSWHWSGLNAGAVYTVEVSLISAESPMPFVFRFEDMGPDDHGDLYLTATPWVPSEQPVTGRGEHAGERDVLAFDTVADHVYAIDCTFPTQAWQLYFYQFGSTGYGGVDGSSFAQTQAATAFKSPGGPHYVSIQDRNPAPSSATYSCVLRDKGLEDHGETLTTATALPQGTTSIQGKLDYVADMDDFLLGVLPGHFYRVSCNVVAGPTPCIAFAENGFEKPGDPSKVTFKALASPHFLGVNGDRVIPARWVETPYTLQFEDLGADDHGDSADTATPLTGAPQTVTAHFTDLSDFDVFSFQAVEGQRYQFSSAWREGEGAGQILSIISNERGSSVRAPRTRDGSRWVQDFTAPATGTYFIEFLPVIEANLGDYTFQFEALAP